MKRTAAAGNAGQNGADGSSGVHLAVDLEHDVHAANFLDVLLLHAVQPQHLCVALLLGQLAGLDGSSVVAAALGEAGQAGSGTDVLVFNIDADGVDALGIVSARGSADEAAFSGKTEADMADFSEEAVKKYYGETVTAFTGMDGIDEESEKNRLTSYVQDYASISDRDEVLAGSALSGLGMADIAVDADGNVTVNGGANDSSNSTIPKGMALIEASDSKIILNGAELTSSSAVVSANGLDITLTGLTKTDEPITFSVTNDTESVYNSIKSFLKEYNSVMKEMNTLYNADSAKGYEPLTSEEKEAMSDDDVKLWEDKIKNSLLRSDSTLSSIMSSMRSAMMSTVEYDGKTYALSSFGIMTSTDYTEGGLLHIYGDADDSVYSAKDDKLKKALDEDPDAVIATLTGVFGKLRETMSQKMSATKYSSSLTFYNDIKMKSDVKSYEDEIEDWEDRLAEMEDSYYSKFTAMETALAKLQSQQSSMSSLFSS